MTMLSDRKIGVDLSQVFEAAQKGDPQAWNVLYDECSPMICRAVRRRLGRSMRSLFDSMDFANDVMKSLHVKMNALYFPTMEHLFAFLAKAAEQKVIDEYRKRHTLKRDMNKERRLFTDDADQGALQLPSTGPTASQLAQANEVRDRLLDRDDETECLIVDLKRLGYSTSDIATKTGWHLRKVQRFLEDLRESLPD